MRARTRRDFGLERIATTTRMLAIGAMAVGGVKKRPTDTAVRAVIGGVAILALAAVSMGCASGSRGAARRPIAPTSAPADAVTPSLNGGSSPATSATTRPTPPTPAPRTPAPPTTVAPRPPTPTTLRLPPLPAPQPLRTLVTPPLPGEGVWLPAAGARLARGYALYTTQLRPAAGAPTAGVAWIDSAATRLVLYAGTSEPYGIWPQQGDVAAPQTPALVASFNAGFKIYSYGTGWYDQGRAAVALQPGAASLVIFSNGTATVGEWGRDVALAPAVVAVRQNLTLLVDRGAAAATVLDAGQWGAVLGGGVYTWRSGLGVTAAGDLVYVGGPDLDPASLARVLIAAGAVRAMELDINPEWVSFSTFAHVGGAVGQSIVSAANLLAGMYFQPGHYLQPFSRDFFAVFAR